MKKQKFYQKTWFVILSLIFLAPLGVFLMFKYKTWNKALKIILSVIFLLFFFIVVIANASGSNTGNSPSDSGESVPSSSTSSENASSEAESSSSNASSESTSIEETDEEKVNRVVESEFGKENIIDVNYVPANNYLLIKAKGKENLSSKMTVKGMYLSINGILKELSDLKDIDIDFVIVYPLQDEYGNSNDANVIKATYTSETRDKINWDSFLWNNVPNIADDWWIHNALKNALDE